MSNPVESFVELKYFTPFSLEEIPEHVLEIVYQQALGHTYKNNLERPFLPIKQIQAAT